MDVLTVNRATILALALVTMFVWEVGVVTVTRVSAGTPYHAGELFVSSGNGKIKHFTADGTLIQTLDTTTNSTEETGMALDGGGNLFTTNFTNSTVSKFDSAGNLLQANFGSGYNNSPESIVFDTTGNMYVGLADGSRDLLKVNAIGAIIARYDTITEARGTDWIDLASDQCTMFYTSEGALIKRYNVCTNTQLPDFAAGLPGECRGLRLLADGGALVACGDAIRRVNFVGAVIQTYDAPNENSWFVLALNIDGTSFWTANTNSGTIFRFDIATAAQLSTFASSPAHNVAGLAVVGEPRPAVFDAFHPVSDPWPRRMDRRPDQHGERRPDSHSH